MASLFLSTKEITGREGILVVAAVFHVSLRCRSTEAAAESRVSVWCDSNIASRSGASGAVVRSWRARRLRAPQPGHGCDAQPRSSRVPGSRRLTSWRRAESFPCDRMLFDVYSLLVLAAVILSWTRVEPDNPIRKITDATVEPCSNPSAVWSRRSPAWTSRR